MGENANNSKRPLLHGGSLRVSSTPDAQSHKKARHVNQTTSEILRLPDDVWQLIFRILIISDEISIEQEVPYGMADAISLASSCLRLYSIYRDLCSSFKITSEQSLADVEYCCGDFSPSAIFPQLIRMAACNDGMRLSVNLCPEDTTCPHLITSLTKDILIGLPKIHRLKINHYDVGETEGDDLSVTRYARKLTGLRSLTVANPRAKLIELCLGSKKMTQLSLFFNPPDNQSSVENENQVLIQLKQAFLNGQLRHLSSFLVNPMDEPRDESFARIIVCVPRQGNNEPATTLTTLANDCLNMLGTEHLFQIHREDWLSHIAELETETGDERLDIAIRERNKHCYCPYCTVADEKLDFPHCFNMQLPDTCIGNTDQIREWTNDHDMYSVHVRLNKLMNPMAYSAYLQYALSLQATDNALFMRELDHNHELGTMITNPGLIPVENRPSPIPLEFWNSEHIHRDYIFTMHEDKEELELPESAERFLVNCSTMVTVNVISLWLPNPLFRIRDLSFDDVHTIQLRRVGSFFHVLEAIDIDVNDLLLNNPNNDDDDNTGPRDLPLSETQKREIRRYVDGKWDILIRKLKHVLNQRKKSAPLTLFCEYPFRHDDYLKDYFCPLLMHIARHAAPNIRVMNFCLQSLEVLHFDGKLQEFIKAIGNELTVIHIQELFWTRINCLRTTSLQILSRFLDMLPNLLEYVQKYCPKLTTLEVHQLTFTWNEDFERIGCLNDDEELQKAVDDPLVVSGNNYIRNSLLKVGKCLVDCQKSVEKLQKDRPDIEMGSIVKKLDLWALETKIKEDQLSQLHLFKT